MIKYIVILFFLFIQKETYAIKPQLNGQLYSNKLVSVSKANNSIILQFDNQFKHIRGPSKPLATSNHIGANSPEACFKFMTTNLEHNEEGGTLKTIAQMQNRMTRGVLKSYDNQVERWLLTNYSHHRQLKNIVFSSVFSCGVKIDESTPKGTTETLVRLQLFTTTSFAHLEDTII